MSKLDDLLSFVDKNATDVDVVKLQIKTLFYDVLTHSLYKVADEKTFNATDLSKVIREEIEKL